MKWIKTVLIAFALMSQPALAALPTDSVSYITKGEPLFITIRTLERTLNTKIVIRGADPDKLVTGKYVGLNGRAFMEDFASRNQLAWAFQDNQIFLAPLGTDLGSKALSSTPNPSSFSKIILDPKDANKNGLMIFQVQNASVDDRKISSGSTAAKVVPGVATLFANFIGAPLPAAPVDDKKPAANAIPESAKNQNSLLGLFTKSAQTVTGVTGVSGSSEAALNDKRGVYADSRLNAILVRDKVVHFEAYKQIIALLDRPADMVQLEAYIVDILKEKSTGLGINLGLTGNASSQNLILNPLNSREFFSRIRAMETIGQAETLSVPSVVSLNNEQALFSSRQNFFISVAGQSPGAASTISQVTAETQLLVTPMIANDSPNIAFDERRVKLLVNIQDAQANGTSSKSVDGRNEVTTLPSTTENQVTTQAVVRSGDTLVIGGQIVRKKSKASSGLPVAGEIPFFGAFFAQKSDEYHDYVRVYVVRPQILGEDSRSANDLNLSTPMHDLGRRTVR